MIACAAAPSRAAGKDAAAHAPAATARSPAPPLPIGEINTYKALPAFGDPYRRGWTLALEQVNAQGGVLGRKLAVRSRDDHGKPDDAIRAARTLVEKDGVVALFGGYSSEVALALSRYADGAKVPYLAVAPLSQQLTWQDFNRHTFRLRPGAWMLAAAVAPKALGQRKTRWALVYQDTASDRATVDAYKGLMKTFQSKTVFVADQAVAPGKFDAQATVAKLKAAGPDAIFNMLTGKELAAFARAGAAVHLFDNVAVVSLFTGDPENLALLDASTPDGWIITGYPPDAVNTPENQAFVQAYRERYGETPDTAAVLGYTALNSIVEALKRAGAADREALAAAFPRLEVRSPFGAIEYRNLDHQSTLGTYLGYTGHENGRLAMERFAYVSGARLQPPDEQIRRLRVLASRAAAAGGSTDTPGAESTPRAAGAAGAVDASHTSATAAMIDSGRAAAAGSTADAPRAAASANSGRSTARPALPAAMPDNALTARLRAARKGAASAPPPPATPASKTSTPAGLPAGAHAESVETSIRADSTPARVLTPALPQWPDEVRQAAPGATR